MNSPRNRGWYPARVHPFSSGNGKGALSGTIARQQVTTCYPLGSCMLWHGLEPVCSTLAKCFATSSLLLPLGKMLRPSDSVGGGSEMPGTLGQPKAVAISSHPFADLKAVSSMSQLVAVIHQQHHLQQVLLAHLRWQTQQDSVKLFCCHSDSNPNPLKKRISKHMHLQKLQHKGCPDCGYAHTTTGPLVGNKTHGRAPWFSNSFSMSSRERFLAACAQQPHILKAHCFTTRRHARTARIAGLDKVCTTLAEFPVLFGGRAQLRFQFRAAPLDFTEFLMK